MFRRLTTLVAVLLLLFIVVSGSYPALSAASVVAPRPLAAPPVPQVAAALPGTPMCFVETGYCLRGAFLLYWRVNGGLPQYG
jgi:hypothetical protein